MTNIYIIRHAEKDSKGVDITQRGKKQIKFLIKRLRKLNIRKIYSSDLDRCKKTTKLINKKLNIETVYKESLREVEGKVKENPSKYKNKINKIKKFYNQLIKEKGNVLVVGSGIFNRILISMFLGISPKYSNFVQIPTGLTHVEKKEDGKFSLIYVNDTSHLPDELKIRQTY